MIKEGFKEKVIVVSCSGEVADVVENFLGALKAGMPGKVNYSVTNEGVGAMPRNIKRKLDKPNIGYNEDSVGIAMSEVVK